MPVTDPSTPWDARYADRTGTTASGTGDRWLAGRADILERSRNGLVLELGCGGGRDSSYLTGLGLQVVACDYSRPALEICRSIAPEAMPCLVDLREPLPFADETFPVVVASLCLHYFPWPLTLEIMAEIRRCLEPGGFLLVRVNSTRDLHFGAVGHPQVEPNLFLVNGELKRFFDREAVESLIGSAWKVHDLKELTVDRYHSPKVLWDALLEKESEPGAATVPGK